MYLPNTWKSLSYSYYDKSDLIEFTNSNYIYVNSYKDFKNISENFEYFLIASWRDYEPLVKLLKNYKKRLLFTVKLEG